MRWPQRVSIHWLEHFPTVGAHVSRSRPPCGVHLSRAADNGELFAEILQCDLEAFIEHLLVLAHRLFRALRAAMEELDHVCDRGGGLLLSSASIRVVDPTSTNPSRSKSTMIEQGPDKNATRRFVADTEHLGAIALRGDVL